MKAKFVSLISILLCLIITGCYDMKEIDETAYIVALGIDKGDNSGFSYTFQFSAPLAITNSSDESESSSSDKPNSSENKTVTNLTVNAPDFYVARNMTNNFMSKNADMSHLKLIVFSAEVSATDIEHHSQLLLREREIRPHTAIAVSESTAKNFLEKVNPELESNTSKYYELMSLQSNNVYAPTKKLHDFVDELTVKHCDTVLPLATNGEKTSDIPADSTPIGWVSNHDGFIESQNSVLCGMAIFKEGKLTSVTNGDDAMIFNILNRNIESCTVTVKNKYNPDCTVSFRIIIPQKACYGITPKSNTVTVTQELRAEFLGSILPEGYGSFDELYSHIRNMITNRIQIFLYDISRNKSADILGLRNQFRKKFLTENEWESYDWKSFYTQTQFTVNITLL